MASNTIPTAINDLFRLSNEAQAGAAALGNNIPLMINTSGDIGSARGNLFQLEAQFQHTLSTLKDARKPLVTARNNGMGFATATRNWLEYTYGSKFNQDWRQVGFIHNTLRIPSDDTELAALLEKMSFHLGQNPALENPDPKVNVTAARANTFAAAITTAITGLNSKEQDSVDHKSARDTAKKYLRRRLGGLVSELGQRLADDDGRWRRFGLNLPAATNMPMTPTGVVVNTNTSNEFFILCAPAKHATHYRFFTQRPGLDEEPVFVGDSDEPMLHLTALETGQPYDVFVSAANSGAESRLSAPVRAVVSGTQEEAA